VHLAREAGPLIPIPQAAIDRLYDRYQNVYGQNTDARRAGTAQGASPAGRMKEART
jgi:L-ribulose-5-phosphate 4-epimerase